MTREQWQAHLKSLRERADVLRLQRRSVAPPLPPLQEELAEQASRRILEDESLQPGDVVSTSRGLFRFQGSPNRERTPDDFVRNPLINSGTESGCRANVDTASGDGG